MGRDLLKDWEPGELKQLAVKLFKTTGIKFLKPLARRILAIVSWILAPAYVVAVHCLINNTFNGGLPVSIVVLLTVLGGGISLLMPLGLAFTLRNQFAKWPAKLQSNESLIPVLMIPGVGRLIWHGYFTYWRSIVLVCIAPFVLGSIVVLYWVIQLRLDTGYMDSRSLIVEVCMLTVPLITCIAVLVVGSNWWIRILVGLSAAVCLSSPVWSRYVWRLVDRNSDIYYGVLYPILVLAHLLILGLVIYHSFIAPKQWELTLMDQMDKKGSG